MTSTETQSLIERRRMVRTTAGVLDVLGVVDGRVSVLRAESSVDAAAVSRSENILFELDEQLPMDWFRARFADLAARRAEQAMTTEALCDYGSLLARRASDLPRIDRIEFIATRLLTRELPDGQLEALPQAEFFNVLARLDLRVAADAAHRDEAVAFFLDAARRLAACTSVKSILADGLYGEVQAYKRSLRRVRLDPAILYASVLLSAAITNHLVRFAEEEALPRKTLLSRVACTDVDIDKILSASDDVVLPPRVPRYKLIFTDVGVRRRAPFLVALVAVGAAYLFRGPVAEENDLAPMPPRLLEAVSPLLLSAEVSSGAAPRVVIAHVDGEAWRALDPAQRRARAAEMAAALGHQGIRAALMYDSGALVVQVENGAVITAR